MIDKMDKDWILFKHKPSSGPGATAQTTMHQSASSLLRTTQDTNRPYAQDLADLFTTLIASLDLRSHRHMFKTYACTFTTEDCLVNLASLRFTQSNRMTDPNDSRRIVTTTTTTTFSMARDMARTTCVRFIDAGYIEPAYENHMDGFRDKMRWKLTPKGLYILKCFSTRSGMMSGSIATLLVGGGGGGGVNVNGFEVIMLERDAETDDIALDRASAEVVFCRFAGATPNCSMRGRGAQGPRKAKRLLAAAARTGSSSSLSSAASDSSSGDEAADTKVSYGVCLTERVESGSTHHCFSAADAIDWLLRHVSVVDLHECMAIASAFITHGLVESLIGGSRIETTSSIANYAVTDHGRRVAGWDMLPSRNPSPHRCRSSSPSPATAMSSVASSNVSRTQQILSDPALRLLFREFLRQSFCEENLQFYLEAERLLQHHKSHPQNESVIDEDRECLAKAYALYNAYLANGSPCELNLDYTLRTALATKMAGTVLNTDVAIRDAVIEVMALVERAQQQVYKLMASDSVPKFTQTEPYLAAIYPPLSS